MGLKSAPHGVKADLCAREPSAFREYDTLLNARRGVGTSRAETFVAVDGNVLFRAVPMSCRTLDEYVHFLQRAVLAALGAGRYVAIVFDEPGALTSAKSDEQRRRDARSGGGAVTASADIDVPRDDSYSTAQLEACANLHPLIDNRGTRGRLFDELARRLVACVDAQMQQWATAGHDPGAVAFDGVDEEGAARPRNAPRRPTTVVPASNSVDLKPILDRPRPIGEGDLKLRDIESRLVDSELDVKLLMISTIDTDSIALGLLQASQRAVLQPQSPLCALLCMRERASRTDGSAGYYRCADLSLLRTSLLKRVTGATPDAHTSARAIALVVAGWAASGCDFVEIKGMRANVALDAVSALVLENPQFLLAADAMLNGDESAMSNAHNAVKQILNRSAAILNATPRLRKSAAAISNADHDAVRRVAWTTAYWCGHDLNPSSHGFGQSLPICSDDFFQTGRAA